MKKFLSLALALVMAISLVTVAASAKDFSDKSKITYTEAVSTLTGIGVIDGYTDGSFGPSGNITRGAAAKIICNLVLGPTTAAALGTTTAPFKDVPTSNTFAGYIAYCSAQGIISGYADGTFKPANSVTGYQFLKMLLGALGYDATIEGFTGTNWAVNVAKLASNLGLTSGNDNFVGTKAASREEACLYAFNTLFATMVDYDTKGSQITINGVVIAQGASKAASVYSGTSAAKNFNYDDNHKNSANAYTLEFAERYFSNLTETKSQLDGRQTRTLKYKGASIASASTTDTILATSTNGTALEKLAASNNSKYIGYSYNYTNSTAPANLAAATGVTYYKNGATSDYATVNTDSAKKGVVIDFIDTNSDGKYEVVRETLDTIAKVTADPTTTTSGAVTYVTVAGLGIAKVDSSDVYGYASVAKGDYALYHTDGNGNYFISKAASVSGDMTAYTSGTPGSIVVSGTSYNVSEITGAQTLDTLKNTSTGVLGLKNTTFYQDKGGNVAYAVASQNQVSAANVLFVTSSKDAGYTVQSKVVMSDASTKTITVSKIGTTSVSAATDITANKFYTYSMNTDGTYKLEAITNQTATSTATTIKKGVADFAGEGKLGTSATVFVLEGSTDGSYTAYTGIANTATYTTTAGNIFTVWDSDGYAIMVVGMNGTGTDTTSSKDVVFATGNPSVNYNSTNSTYTATYNAVVNGKITTITSTYTAGAGVLTKGELCKVATYDGTNAATLVAAGTGTGNTSANTDLIDKTTGITKITASGSTVGIYTGTTLTASYVLNSSCKMFVFDTTNSDTLTEYTDAAALTNLNGSTYTVQVVYNSTSDATITYLFVTIA